MPDITGVWSYIGGLLSALSRCAAADTFVAFVSPESESLVPGRGPFESVRIDLRASVRPLRVAYENTAFCSLARRHRLDCLHWFSGTAGLPRPAPAVVTIYDLQPYLRLSPYSWHKRLYLKLMTAQTIRRARLLLPMSEATAAGLTRILGVAPDRMTVIPPVLDEQFRPAAPGEAAGFRERRRLPGRFWLYVAHFYPHKNHLRLLQAYASLKPDGQAWPLVFRGDDKGAEVEVREAIRELGLQNDVILLPRLEREELRLLYAAATALIFPSLYEGGGMPVVEAMACGLPVAVSRIPPVLEFAGPGALYFNPRETGAIAGAMRRLAGEPARLEAARREGLARASHFRAEAVVPRLRGAYLRAAASR